jgi:hypothetical protein
MRNIHSSKDQSYASTTARSEGHPIHHICWILHRVTFTSWKREAKPVNLPKMGHLKSYNITGMYTGHQVLNIGLISLNCREQISWRGIDVASPNLTIYWCINFVIS